MVYIPPQHAEALQNQLETGTPEQQKHALEAMQNLGIKPDQPKASVPDGESKDSVEPIESPKIPEPKKVSPVVSQEQAKAIFEAAGGDPRRFFYNPEGTGVPEDKARDPETKFIYDRGQMVEIYGQRDQFGNRTGEVAWDKFHQDVGRWVAFEILKNGGSPVDEDYRRIRNDYGDTAANAAKQFVNEYYQEERRKQAEKVLKPVISKDGTINMVKLAALISEDSNKEKQILKHLNALGYDGKDALKIIKEAGQIPKYEYDPDTMMEHMESKMYQKGTAQGILLDILPVTSTLRLREEYMRDDNIQGGELGLILGSAVLDVASIAPVLKAASVGAKSAPGITRTARIKGAVSGLWQGTVAEVAAPFTTILHPVQTAKGTYKGMADIVENLAHPKKIPIDAAEITTATTRLGADLFESEDIAMAVRDRVTQNAIEGIDDSVKIGEVEAKLSQVPIGKMGEVTAVHSTPDIRPFLEGATVQAGREGGLFVSPSIHTRFTKASAFGDIPEGGIPGALLIRDKRVTEALQGSQKIFKGTAEVERVIPEGIDLDAPSQILFTRDNQGNVLKLLVIGKPYTKTEIARLKIAGMADTITTMFKPAATVKGGRQVSRSYDEVNDIRREITKIQDELAEARKVKDADLIKSKSDELRRLEGDLDDAVKQFRRISDKASARAGVATLLAYTTDSPLSRYRDMVEPKNTKAGRYEMPDIDVTRPGRRVDRPEGIDRSGRRPDRSGDLDRPGRWPDRPGDPDRPGRRPDRPGDPDRPPIKPPPDTPPTRPPDSPPPDRPPAEHKDESDNIPKDEEKRGEPGIVVWRQGEVTEDGKRKSVFIIAHHDGTMLDRGKGGVKVVTKPPAGIRRRTGTPQETLTALGGKPPKKLDVKTGMFRAIVEDGRSIHFDRIGRQGRIERRKKLPRIVGSDRSRGERGRVLR